MGLWVSWMKEEEGHQVAHRTPLSLPCRRLGRCEPKTRVEIYPKQPARIPVNRTATANAPRYVKVWRLL